MEYNDDYEIASEYAMKVLARLKKLEIPMSPNNFELWYVYYARQNQEVIEGIDGTIKEGRPITTQICDDLHKKYLLDNKKNEKVREAGDKMNDALAYVTDMVREAKASTEQYGESLTGASNSLTQTDDIEELKTILAAVAQDTEQMIEKNRRLEEELEQSGEEMATLQRDLDSIRKEAMTDGLTAISNRKAFDEKLKYVRQRSDEEASIFTLMLIDIDHFKNFNDTYGHQVGDQVLKLVAKTLTDGIKGKDFAARYGGEEFAIILPESNAMAGEVVGNALREAVAKKEVINRNSGEKLGRITMSVGVAQYSGSESEEALIERADKALYKAKETGRNRVVVSE
ncbi:MAG: GGDEF domain-containing protein [Pseudomonadota bacterium]|nr:GGDEF domain-containing protein [Pseudomonadota bacterium]MEE3323440.1 GGDEF domain-containing protein [Pseudomonadota bacterium]